MFDVGVLVAAAAALPAFAIAAVPCNSNQVSIPSHTPSKRLP